MQAHHSVGFVFKKCCKCIFVERQCNDHYGTNCISINLSNYTFPNFIKLIWLDSLWEMQAQHAIGFVFYKSCQCNFVERKYNAYYVTICKSNNLSNYTFPNFMKLIWLDSLLRIEGNHHPGFRIWKHLESILEMGKGIWHIARFWIFAIVAI